MAEEMEEASMRLVEHEFEEESLSDHENDHINNGNNRQQQHSNSKDPLSMIRTRTKTMGECGQVMVFLMAWSVMIGVGMLVIHIVAKHDHNRQTVQMVALGVGWIALSNLFAFTFFVIDRFRLLAGAKQMSYTVAVTLIAIGGVVGGWLGVCLTVYKPPTGLKFTGFFGKALLSTAFGIAIDVFIILRIVLPHRDDVLQGIV